MREGTVRRLVGVRKLKLYDRDAANELRHLLSRFTLAPVAHLPTPLQDCPRLWDTLGGPRILIKRDDKTGLAMGGNKARQFTYSLGPALDNKCDYLVHGSDSQSNQSAQTAAAAARLGMKSLVIIPRDHRSYPVSGNLILNHLIADQIKYVFPMTVKAELAKQIDILRAKGLNPYDTSQDGAILRAVAYVDAALELCQQLEEMDIKPKAIYTSSMTYTIVGLVVGLRAISADITAVGLNYWVGDDKEMQERLAPIANECASIIGIKQNFTPDDFNVTCEFAKPDFGEPSKTSLETMRIVAHSEGIILDPVYTAKAMDGLVKHIRNGRFQRDEVVIFLHTGGTPAIFAYGDELFG